MSQLVPFAFLFLNFDQHFLQLVFFFVNFIYGFWICICADMAEKGGSIVPESVLKKQKRNEEWALAKKQEVEASKKKKLADRKLIYNKAKLYAKEYEEQAREIVQLKREARLKGGFYVSPEAKLLFIIRIRG